MRRMLGIRGMREQVDNKKWGSGSMAVLSSSQRSFLICYLCVSHCRSLFLRSIFFLLSGCPWGLCLPRVSSLCLDLAGVHSTLAHPLAKVVKDDHSLAYIRGLWLCHSLPMSYRKRQPLLDHNRPCVEGRPELRKWRLPVPEKTDETGPP